MIYLASVYSFEADEYLMQKRYQYVARRVAALLKTGTTVFSPINHCHPLSQKFDMPRNWEFWKQHDMNYIRASDELWVLMMPHWEDSVGISAEIKYADSLAMPIHYLLCNDYEEETSNERN